MKLIFYGSTRSPVQTFIKRLDVRDRAKVLACLRSVEELGLGSPRVEFRQIEGKLWEIKIKAATAGYRIFYITLQQDTLVLLHAYKKQSQKAPRKEIVLAKQRLLEVINHASDYLNGCHS